MRKKSIRCYLFHVLESREYYNLGKVLLIEVCLKNAMNEPVRIIINKEENVFVITFCILMYFCCLIISSHLLQVTQTRYFRVYILDQCGNHNPGHSLLGAEQAWSTVINLNSQIQTQLPWKVMTDAIATHVIWYSPIPDRGRRGADVVPQCDLAKLLRLMLQGVEPRSRTVNIEPANDRVIGIAAVALIPQPPSFDGQYQTLLAWGSLLTTWFLLIHLYYSEARHLTVVSSV